MKNLTEKEKQEMINQSSPKILEARLQQIEEEKKKAIRMIQEAPENKVMTYKRELERMS